MPTKTPGRDPYLVKSVVHSSQLLSAFRTSGEALPLREISTRSGLPKSMAFRLLYTLERCGMIEKVGENLYRSHVRPFKQKPFRLGYAAQGTDYQFSKEVSVGLQRAATAHGVELICVDNRYNPKIAQRNAEVLVREKVDLVIEFQTDEHVAATVAAKYRDAEIPLIALEVPHPGATYFGANNYEAGLIGGRHLGRWAKQCWHSEVDEIVMIALERAGSLPKMRLTGMLVGAINDPSALGALRAFQEAGRSDACAVMGQNAAPEGRAELRQPGTRLIGSVAYFPEKYGAEILALALDILHRRPVPPAIFVKHQLVTPENVDHIYPNDRLMQLSGGF